MKRRTDGFAMVEVVLIVIAVVLLGLVAWRAFHSNKSTSEPVAATDVSVPSAPAISSTDDLNSAQQTLDQVNPDDSNSDVSQLDSELAGF